MSKELLNFKTKTMPYPLPNGVVNIGQDAQWNANKHDMQIIHFELCFSGTIWLSLLSENDSSKMAPFWDQNLLISFLICLYLIAVLIKVKVNRLSISGRSLQDKWRHRHLNSRDSAFQNGDLFQVLTDFIRREDILILRNYKIRKKITSGPQ